MLHDPVFWDAIRHTVLFFVVTFVVQTLLGLTFAVLLHSRVKFAAVYKVIIFIPVVLAPAIMAPVFRHIFAPDGEFNGLLQRVGLGIARPAVDRADEHRAAGDHGDHDLGVDRPHLRPLLRGDDPGRPVDARGGPDRRRRQPADAGQHRLAGVRGTTIALAILSVIGALKTFDVP